MAVPGQLKSGFVPVRCYVNYAQLAVITFKYNIQIRALTEIYNSEEGGGRGGRQFNGIKGYVWAAFIKNAAKAGIG